MFGFSLLKLVVLGVIVLAVWHGFKWFNRYQQIKDAETQAQVRLRTGESFPSDAAEEMVKCGQCGSFVMSSAARSCGKDGCPY
jgi:hypothetical protein